MKKWIPLLLFSFYFLLVKSDNDNPLDYLKDTFDIVRPFSVIENKNGNISFHCKPAKGDHFDLCWFKTPNTRVYSAQQDGSVLDMEPGNPTIVPGVHSFFEKGKIEAPYIGESHILRSFFNQ